LPEPYVPDYLRLVLDQPSNPSPDGSDESALVAQLRAGNETAFETLFRAYYIQLVAFAVTYVRTDDVAEEIVGDIFAWLWDHRATWTPERSIRAFLFGAVRNRALNVQRDAASRHRAASRVADAATVWIGSTASSADDAVQHRELYDTVWNAVATLSERQRTLLSLRWEDGMSWAEIAAVLGMTPNAAEILHRKALRALRDLLPTRLR
jgi:RNA polymerase sigma-70 factor (ECF subfamily)